MEYPLVSAIVMCYNHARFVTDCLNGVKDLAYPNLELIVNDDASRDDSAKVIEAWLVQCNLPHKFLRNQKNLGICRSLNNAMAQARGKYVCGIAADDIWLPGKLRTQVAIMEGLPARVGVIYSDALQIDETGTTLPEKFIVAHRHFERIPQGDLHHILWEDNFIPAMTTLVRRDCYDQVGWYDESLFYEDWDMWLRLSKCFEFAYSPEVTAKYRLVATSMMRGQTGRMFDAVCRVCVKHLASGSLDPQAKRLAKLQLQRKAAASFDFKSPGYKQNLLGALRYGPSAGIIARCLFAWSGLGADRFQRVRTTFSGPERPERGQSLAARQNQNV
jgi:glycosyltransferase involved in cell wall biosynthesis